ncbi:MAG: ABC transporter permease [Granulosicoccaceae bacterium]
MLHYLIKRLTSLVLTLLVASVVLFVTIEIVPGDPASFMLGINAQAETLEALRTELGLDKSKPQRYWQWLTGMLQGDFGKSYTYKTPVAAMIGERMWISLPLTLFALLISTLIAFPAGIYAASRRGRIGDAAVTGMTQLGVAIPNFWFAMLLVSFFAIKLGWFSSGGFIGWDQGLLVGLKSLLLPAIALALPQAAILTRVTRSSLLDVLSEDYMRTARAKGMSKRSAIWRHGLRNAMIPVLTILGLQFSFLLAGAIIIEKVFYLPGLGLLVFQSIAQRDLIVVESVVMLLVFAVVLVTFLVDLAYAWVDPRLRTRS